MKFIFSAILGNKGRVYAKGDVLDLLTLLTVISQSVTERISEEKDVQLDEAMSFVLDSIKSGCKNLNLD